MNHLLIVAAGGAIGASLRHLTGLAAMRLLGLAFPWGTLTVNLVGSFVMGAFVEWLARRAGASSELRLFMATGLLGGFTTFSAFSLDVAVLWERGEGFLAASYVFVSVCGAIAALFAGLYLVRHFA
ncbi:fluoride efflux transporter CrcB [Nitratireductor kimnyeongensis]|uniref:Fluoride-specific ion channel FluC n=1 Tax=Nitratireductor kimnyeongensis TaxID=430679 RepID=A0ABW0TB86_9HYPH|nr:fluoride efflux transporter CrcB [Nitratireductor kimnyeongensis]QZZ35571.1 fluoride efflux transporter CrcB [Nitratireductor kimnyeongensis]